MSSWGLSAAEVAKVQNEFKNESLSILDSFLDSVFDLFGPWGSEVLEPIFDFLSTLGPKGPNDHPVAGNLFPLCCCKKRIIDPVQMRNRASQPRVF